MPIIYTTAPIEWGRGWNCRLSIADCRYSKLETRNSKLGKDTAARHCIRVSIFEFRFSAPTIDPPRRGNQQSAITDGWNCRFSRRGGPIAGIRNSKLEIRNSEKTPLRRTASEFRFSAPTIDNQQSAIITGPRRPSVAAASAQPPAPGGWLDPSPARLGTRLEPQPSGLQACKHPPIRNGRSCQSHPK